MYLLHRENGKKNHYTRKFIDLMRLDKANYFKEMFQFGKENVSVLILIMQLSNSK